MFTENQKYIDIFDTGKNLFWKYGLKRVSIEEICREAKVSKMTFYKFFPNKIELAKTILTKVYNDSLIKFENVVNSNMSFSEITQELFLIKSEAAKNISLDFMDDLLKNPNPEIHKLIEEKSSRSLNIFIKFLKDSQAKGLFRKDIKIEFVLYYVNHMSQILEDANLVKLYKQPSDLVIEAMNFLFYGLSIKND